MLLSDFMAYHKLVGHSKEEESRKYSYRISMTTIYYYFIRKKKTQLTSKAK